MGLKQKICLQLKHKAVVVNMTHAIYIVVYIILGVKKAIWSFGEYGLFDVASDKYAYTFVYIA